MVVNNASRDKKWALRAGGEVSCDEYNVQR